MPTVDAFRDPENRVATVPVGAASSASTVMALLERLHSHYKYLDEQIADI
jgi:hypothetical protein